MTRTASCLDGTHVDGKTNEVTLSGAGGVLFFFPGGGGLIVRWTKCLVWEGP